MIDFVMHKITAGLGESFSQKIVINIQKNKKNLEKKKFEPFAFHWYYRWLIFKDIINHLFIPWNFVDIYLDLISGICLNNIGWISTDDHIRN